MRKASPGAWDLVVAAPWIDIDHVKAADYIGHLLASKMVADDAKYVSQFTIVSCENPDLRRLIGAIGERGVTEGHGVLPLAESPNEVVGLMFSGQEILRGYLFALLAPEKARAAVVRDVEAPTDGSTADSPSLFSQVEA
jgi:hypothetical protein